MIKIKKLNNLAGMLANGIHNKLKNKYCSVEGRENIDIDDD